MFIESLALERRKLESDWRTSVALLSKEIVDSKMLSRQGDEIWIAIIRQGRKYLPMKVCGQLLNSNFVYSKGIS